MTHSLEEYKAALPESAHKFLDRNLAADQKMMLAQGLLPLPPAQVTDLCVWLLGDSDAQVAAAAKSNLLEVPTTLLTGILQQCRLGDTLDFFAKEKSADVGLMERVVLNPITRDDTLATLAEACLEPTTVILANNQVRLLRHPAIGEGLKRNPNMLRSNLDMMVSFLRMNGIVLEGESSELTDAEIMELLSMKDAASELPPELTEEVPEEQVTEEKKQSIYQLIQTLNIAQKIKLALKGNKEARAILVKDNNKIICSSVIKNPKITDMEIMAIAQLRTVNDEVIRLICMKPDWVKHYNVQVALANNPKTPFPVALRFIRGLRVSDLGKLAKNKNIASQLAKIAKELFETKRK